MSNPSLYLRAAEELRDNPGQWEAYNSTSHCAVVAGPGSGKTKVLTVKLARILAEEVNEPRGIACITYNNECARELENRLAGLGVEGPGRVFIGTVHSFALMQVLIPYARTADIALPEPFRVATSSQQTVAFRRAFERTIDGSGDPQGFRLPMDRYRRSILDRDSDGWHQTDPDMARLVEAYEEELRHQGLIDFDDMPLLALTALRRHEWLRRSILAKYPVLIVDEYQDLGRPLHAMVMGLCFQTGIRLFAVGDVDQSIYGFTGAHPDLLERVASRMDVQTVRLRLNYRCGVTIVAAAEYALGEERGYKAADGAIEGDVLFHPRRGDYDDQARQLFSEVLPEVFERRPDLTIGRVAVLYPAAWIGDTVANQAEQHGLEVVRTDGNALYPRGSRLMRWLEDCAVWCCGGWRVGTPRFSKIVADGNRIFAEAVNSDEKRQELQRHLALAGILWRLRDGSLVLSHWLDQMRNDVLGELAASCATLGDDWTILEQFIQRTEQDENLAGMTLGQFSGFGDGGDRLNLSTLHSAKGREFEVVVLFGMDEGRIPRRGATEAGILEARRLFYVGFTRAKSEVHIMYSQHAVSPFVRELWERLQA